MENNEYIGFSSLDEAELYEDICIGYLFHKSKKPGFDYVMKKNECIEIIKEHNLESLFCKIKELNYLDRLKEIYRYYDELYDSNMIKIDEAELNIQNFCDFINFNGEYNYNKVNCTKIVIIFLNLIREYQNAENDYFYNNEIISEIKYLINLKVAFFPDYDQKEFILFTIKLQKNKRKIRRKEDEED